MVTLKEVDRVLLRFINVCERRTFPQALTAVCPKTFVKCVQRGHPSTLGSFWGGMQRDLLGTSLNGVIFPHQDVLYLSSLVPPET